MPSHRALASAVLLLSLALAACSRAPSPTPTATVPVPTVAPTPLPVSVPSATVAATASPQATPEPMQAPDELPPGWQQQANEQLSIAIPPQWRVVDLRLADAQAAYEALQQEDPYIAGILGGPEALAGAALWAFGPEPLGQEGFVDNLNVRRSPLGARRVANVQEVVDVLLPEYEKMGLQVTSSDPTLSISEFPAARITYTLLTDAPDAKVPELRGRQYVVATDEDLWILSFTTIPEREGELAPHFETSAHSFLPK